MQIMRTSHPSPKKIESNLFIPSFKSCYPSPSRNFPLLLLLLPILPSCRLLEPGHGPVEVDRVVSGAVDVKVGVLHEAFSEGVGFVFDRRRRLLSLHGRGLRGHLGHFRHGLVLDWWATGIGGKRGRGWQMIKR